MEELEHSLEDDEQDDEDEAEDEAPARASSRGRSRSAGAAEEDVESIQDVLVKQEAADDADDEDEAEAVVPASKEERLEPLAVKVVPPQATEFICSNCFLVKHRSQLKDKAKVLCRDCA